MIGYLDKDIISLALIMPKTSGYVKTFEVEAKINKLMSLRIDDINYKTNVKLFRLKI